MNVGDIGSPDGAIGFSFEHNFDKNMKLKTGIVYIVMLQDYRPTRGLSLYDYELTTPQHPL